MKPLAGKKENNCLFFYREKPANLFAGAGLKYLLHGKLPDSLHNVFLIRIGQPGKT
jgi:hypothetical protein